MSEDFQLDYNSIKEILYDCSKTLDGSSNCIGTDDLILNYIDNLLEENEKLNHYKLLYQKVKDRNDKAIEYMKPRFMNCIDNEKRYFADYDIQQIYEILEGFNETD